MILLSFRNVIFYSVSGFSRINLSMFCPWVILCKSVILSTICLFEGALVYLIFAGEIRKLFFRF